MDTRTVVIQIPAGIDERWFTAQLYKAAASLLDETDSRSSLTTEEEEDFESAPVAASTAYEGANLDLTLGRFLRDITENARRLVRAVAVDAAEGRGVTADDLRERLNAHNNGTLGGWAASIGFAVKRLRLPKPYTRKYEYVDYRWQPVYRMTRDAAKYVLELVDEDGDIRE